MGLVDGKKKWQRSSLNKICDRFGLPFNQNDITQIWDQVSQKELSLTKKQVGLLFNTQVEETTELIPKVMENQKQLKKYPIKKSLQKQSSEDQMKKKEQKREINKLDHISLDKLTSKLSTAADGLGILSKKSFLEVLLSLGVKKQDAIASIQHYLHNNQVEYVSWLFKQVEFRQEDNEKCKAKVLISAMSPIEHFTLKDKVNFKEFERVVGQLLKVQLYSTDLDDVWRYWGNPTSLTKQEFEALIKGKKLKNKVKYEYQQEKQKAYQKNNNLNENSFQNKKKYEQQDESNNKINDKSKKNNSKQNEENHQDKRKRKDYDKKSEEEFSDENKKYQQNQRFSFNKDNYAKKNQDSSNQQNHKKKKSYKKRIQDSSNQQNPKRNKKKQTQKNYSSQSDKNQRKDKSYETYERRKKEKYESNEQKYLPNKQYTFKEEYAKKQKQDIKKYNSKNSSDQEPQTPYLKNALSQSQQQIEEQNIRQNKKKLFEQKSLKKNNNNQDIKFKHKSKNKSLKKDDLLKKLQEAISNYGAESIKQLFQKKDNIKVNDFIECLIKSYRFREQEAERLADELKQFNKIRGQQLKKYVSFEVSQRNRPKDRIEQIKKTSVREDVANTIYDKRKQHINKPLIKQHIRQLLTCIRRENINIKQHFFPEKDAISRVDFITACQSITNSISAAMYDKIFDFLHPTPKDVVTQLSLRMNFEEIDIPIQEEIFPQDLEKQLKTVFNKADIDKSGTIQSNQLEGLLTSLGINGNKKQIQDYFKKLDQNFDNKISYKEFKLFIQDMVLPLLHNFDEDIDSLYYLLKMNDLFNNGTVPVNCLQPIFDKYGVKLFQQQILQLATALSPNSDQIDIEELLLFIRKPSKLKRIVYKIRLKKKIFLKDIQKVFENISNSFVLGYTPQIIMSNKLTPATPYQPSPLNYKNIDKADINRILLVEELTTKDMVVELILKEAYGVPLPQSLKQNIVKRTLNACFYDMSGQNALYAITRIQAEGDEDDRWIFPSRSVIVKLSNYESKRHDHIAVLFEFIIAVVENNRTIEISCGSTSLLLKQLYPNIINNKPKLRLIAGIPNKSREIDKSTVAKRSGWKSIFGSQESVLQVQIITPSKDYIPFIASLPSIIITAKKSLPFLWTHRELLAEELLETFKTVNISLEQEYLYPESFMRCSEYTQTVLTILNVPDLHDIVLPFWKEKLKQKDIREAKIVMRVLLEELSLVVRAKQFELLPSLPMLPVWGNKSLLASRTKIVVDVLESIEAWIKSGIQNLFKRKRQTYLCIPYELQRHIKPNLRETIAKISLK